MVWLHPNFKRTIGVIVVTRDVFIHPVSFRMSFRGSRTYAVAMKLLNDAPGESN